jgi:putative membrane protein
LNFITLLLKLRWREALSNFPWRFLLALGIGIGGAIFSLAKVLAWAMENQATFVWSFFFGLVLVSVIVVLKRIRRWSAALVALLAAASLGAYALVGMTPQQTPNEPWFLFLSGALAICAMILPGISGAFILLLLGKYQHVLDAVVQGDFITLMIVAAGGVAGLIVFARLLRWLLKNFHDATIAVLAGLMVGSLRKLWPWKEAVETQVMEGGELMVFQEINVLPLALTIEVVLALALMVLGISLVGGMEFFARKQAQPLPVEAESQSSLWDKTKPE